MYQTATWSLWVVGVIFTAVVGCWSKFTVGVYSRVWFPNAGPLLQDRFYRPKSHALSLDPRASGNDALVFLLGFAQGFECNSILGSIL